MKKIFTFIVAALCSAAMMADVYSVAGSPASLFGAEWDEQSTATEMTLVESHYEWTAQNVYLPAGKVEYKVVLNHDWATSYPVSGNRYSNQLTEGMYNVTIIFHPDTHSMELNAERIGDAPEQGSDYYVVGSMTNWAVDANYRMSANPNADGEYMITAHLLPTDMFKVAKSEDGRNIITWYPDGMENSYGEHGEITEEGDYTIYFRPAGNVEGWFYGYIYVQKGEQGIDQILMDGKAAKVLRNGQLLIIKGEKTYNAQGAIVK